MSRIIISVRLLITSLPPAFVEAKERLPEPFWSFRSDVIKSYWKAWEIAFSNLKQVNKNSSFVSPFINPAFNGNIFMWDCSFMTMYGKYAKSVFNFQNTLNNFYAKQHSDGFICREIRESDGNLFVLVYVLVLGKKMESSPVMPNIIILFWMKLRN